MRILIADDHAIVRDGLRSLLASEAGTEVVGEAEDGRTAVRLAEELSPDVVIMDVTMADLNGVEATEQILGRNPAVKVIILSMHPNRGIVRAALEAGASGYVLKANLFDELRRALNAVATNECYLSPCIARVVVDGYLHDQGRPQDRQAENLTGVERRLLQLLAEGATTKQIARSLHVSPKTVDARRRAIMGKLGVSSMAELVKYAIREGLTSV